MIANGSGRAVAFSLAPGQAHELPQAIGLLARLPSVPRWVVAARSVRNSVYRWAVAHDQAMALVKRSPNRMANWALAMHH